MGSYIRNEHGFKNKAKMCKTKRKKSFSMFHILGKKIKKKTLFEVPLQTSLFKHYCLAYTINILCKVSRLYIYTGQLEFKF